VQSVCELLAPPEAPRLTCRALRDGCCEADAAAGGVNPSLSFAPFFRASFLAAWCEANSPGGALPPGVRQSARLLAASQGVLEWARASGASGPAAADTRAGDVDARE